MNTRFLLPLAAHRWNFSFNQQDASHSGPSIAETKRVDNRSVRDTDTVIVVAMGQLAPPHIRDDYLATPPAAAQLEARDAAGRTGVGLLGNAASACQAQQGQRSSSSPVTAVAPWASSRVLPGCLGGGARQPDLRAVRAALQGALRAKAGAPGDSSHAAQNAHSAHNCQCYGDSHTFKDVSRRLDMPHVSCDACRAAVNSNSNSSSCSWHASPVALLQLPS